MNPHGKIFEINTFPNIRVLNEEGRNSSNC